MTDTMRVLVKPDRQPGLVMSTKDVPKIGPREVLVKIRATSICGTDLHLYNWDSWAQSRIQNIPLVQGHELCGDIVEVGSNVDSVHVGDYISAESHIVDYEGEFYNNGMGHVAPETQIIGIDRDGSFAEYIALPWQNVRKNPQDMPTEIAVLKENFGNAIHAAFATELEGKDVLLTGCGPVGLMALLVARARGARSITAVDISDYRIQFAKRLGADHTINPKHESIIDGVRDLTNGVGVDVLLEMSGAASAIIQGITSVKHTGDVVAFGFPSKPIELDLANLVIFKGLTIYGVVGRMLWDTWEQIEEMLDSGKVDLTPIVTHKFKMEEYEKAFATMADGKSGKVVLYP